MIGVETNPVRVFGDVLRALREKAGLSQRELAERVYCSASLISAIENGTKPAKLDLVKRIDGALNAGDALVKVWPSPPRETIHHGSRSWLNWKRKHARYMSGNSEPFPG